MNREELFQQLDRAERVWLKSIAFEKLITFFKVGVLILSLILSLDLLFQLPALARLLIGGLFAVLVGSSLVWLAREAFLKKCSSHEIVHLLEDQDESLGAKLINILELDVMVQDGAEHDMTRSLARQAIDDLGSDLANRDFVSIIRSRAPRDAGKRFAFPLLTFLVLFVFSFPLSKYSLSRYIQPFAEHSAFSFTKLYIVEPPAEHYEVNFGDSMTIRVGYSGIKPSALFLSLATASDPLQSQIHPMYLTGESEYAIQLHGITEDLRVFARTSQGRSVSEKISIAVKRADNRPHKQEMPTSSAPAHSRIAQHHRAEEDSQP